MSLRTFLAACLVLSAVHPALSPARAGEAPPYVLIDSGFPANEQFQPFWVDNDRVIFKGYEVGSYSKAMHGTPPAEALAQGYDKGMRTGYYLWHTRTGKVTVYKDKIQGLCVEDGQIVYQTIPSDESEKAVVWRGRFGEEQPIRIEPRPAELIDVPRNCWDMFSIRTDAQKGRRSMRLRPDWGYLDIGPMDPPFEPTAPVLYYRTGQVEPIKLPIPRSKLRNGGRVAYAPHAGRHLLTERLANVAEMPQAWFLSQDGALTEVIVPEGPWENVRFYSTRAGVLISSARTKKKSLREPGGVYLIRDGRWELLFAGFKSRADISPDGCKVALTVAPNQEVHYARHLEWQAGRPSQQTMRMINVCEGRSK